MTYFLGGFPSTRLRRLRSAPWIRDIVSESTLRPQDLILPLFIRENDAPEVIEALPGVMRYSLNELPGVLECASRLGILAVALFPCTPAHLKSEDAYEALNPENLICKAIRQVAFHAPQMGIIVDVALDPYTNHGHDGLLINNVIDNDETVAILCRQALLFAEAGATVVAPSDMMDGRIGAIRQMLDSQGYRETLILSYAAKYASSFYGPFRDAVGVTELKGPKDKKTYQMNPANVEEALREAAQDIMEGADILMVKPGLPYLDVVHRVASTYPTPLFVYQVSGEYALFKHYPNQELGLQMLLESLLAFKRAGAKAVLTYAALEVSEFLKTNG